LAVFISYSSQDSAALDGLRAALRRARLDAWIDEELSGGESWWRVILQQIRECDVFIVALSNHSLESKPCQAELRYAQDLKRSILPVRIGPIDSMRANPLAAVQTIDYQNPNPDTAIALISALHELKAQRPPLPEPLPAEPPVPFEYLMRLRNTLEDRELGSSQQAGLLNELRSALDEDGQDPVVRRDITQLLLLLQNRPDVTWKTRTDVEKVLASIGESSATAEVTPEGVTTPTGPQPTQPGYPSTGPQPTQPAYPTTGPVPTPPSYPTTGPQPTHPGYPSTAPAPPWSTGPHPAPPTERSRKGLSRKHWLIGGGALAAVVVIVVALLLAIPSSPPPPPPAPPHPLVTPAQAASLLLSPDQVNSIMGATGMAATGQPRNEPFDETVTISNPNCLGVLYAAEQSVYQGSGFTQVTDQVLHEPGDNPDHVVLQSVAIFPATDNAHAFLTKSVPQWQACAGQTVTLTTTENNPGSTPTTSTVRWTFAQPSSSDTQIALMSTQEDANGWGCQHVLGTGLNIVTDIRACGNHITNEAGTISDKIIANASS
jgi:serine/threonine kinase PknH